MDIDPIEICWGLSQHHQHQAVGLYWEAFSRKLAPLVGTRDRGIALMEKLVEPQRAVVALQQDTCIGLAGLQETDRRFIHPRLSAFVQELGWLRGTPGYIAHRWFDSSPRKGELRIECLAVSSARRGRGIGTRLLSAVFDHARARGFLAVSLEVVDTNPDARRLYERQGFEPVHTSHYPYLRHIAGFSASTLMSKPIV